MNMASSRSGINRSIFRVSLDASHQTEYSSVKDAVDASVSEGFTAANRALIVVNAGTYPDDYTSGDTFYLSFYPGVTTIGPRTFTITET